MSRAHWTRAEVEAVVDDYLAMLEAELAGESYNKSAHRRRLLPKLSGRSESSIEYKHQNISAILVASGMPRIEGYLPAPHGQALLAELVEQRVRERPQLLALAALDADRPMLVPEVEELLAAMTAPPQSKGHASQIAELSSQQPRIRLPINYLEREARNRSLGEAGELFVLAYERARLASLGCERLAERVEHTSKVRGDHEGFDVLSFESDGRERLIEVKTTKYGIETPFWVTANECETSRRERLRYRLYRLFAFRKAPRMFELLGALDQSCRLEPASYRALPG
jgi:hypothetical protein